jgi:hypothetical protein
MGKKAGQTVTIRQGARYDHETNKCNEVSSRSTHTDIITKVMSHGVKTQNSGYVNNNRILNVE